jgi:hypothetical protein
MLELIDFYATKLLATGTADTVPSIYRREDQLNPSRNPSAPAGGQDPSNVDPDYNPWAPPLLFNPKQPKSGTLPSTWLTNEIGRAGVRAIELGIGSNNLRDRDMRRLLNTLDISARRFHELLKLPNSEDARADADVTRCTKVLTWNAGVMIRYLVEGGAWGSRLADGQGGLVSRAWCTTRLTPGGIRLAARDVGGKSNELAAKARDLAEAEARAATAKERVAKARDLAEVEARAATAKERGARAEKLATGSAAGVLLVAASLIAARGRHDGGSSREVPCAIVKAASLITARGREDGGAIHEVPCAIVKAARRPLDLSQRDKKDKAVKLAFSPDFQPEERLIVDQLEDSLRDLLVAELTADQCRNPSLHQARSGSF